MFISVVQKEVNEFSISQIPPFVSLINNSSPLNSLVIVIFISSFSVLFIPGGLKKYKSKTINFFLSSENDSGHFIDVITSLFVKLNKHRGIGISFKSFFSSKFLVLWTSVSDKSTKVSGTHSSFSEIKHSLTIEIAELNFLL